MTSRRSVLWAIAAGFALLLAVAPTASAQSGKLTGLVTDGATGQPVAGAEITVEGTGRSVLSSENGRFFIINVQPGTYTVAVEMLGYATVRRSNVLVAIDVTRTLDFPLTSEALAVDDIIVEADRIPVIETTATGTQEIISIDEIESLPISTINEALALRSGYLDVPLSTEVLSQAEEERGLRPVRIRGGRGGETLTLVDGVPITNFVFGGATFSPNIYAAQQIDFIRGGFEPQYGNALSGIINIALREGGTQLEGALDYNTSAVAGALGSTSDELQGQHSFQGYISGPVPGTDNRLRFALSGREARSASRVLEFDDIVFDPRFTQPELGEIQPNSRDIVPGWRSFGYSHTRDMFGKFTFLVTPLARLNFTAIEAQRQSEPFLFSNLLSAVDPVYACQQRVGDIQLCEAQYDGSTQPGNAYHDLVTGSTEANRNLYIARWDHTIDRLFYNITVSRFDQQRETCNYFQGVCLEDRFANLNFSEGFIAPGVGDVFPASGTGRVFGGEKIRTWMGRFDIEAQVSDHHNLRAGVFYQTHDIEFREARDIGISGVDVTVSEYAASPWEAAAYFQDRIEYDFISIDLGFRFDLGEAGGLFFENPLDPTNGTDAIDVCGSPGEWQSVDVRTFDAETQAVATETMSAGTNWTVQHCAENRDDLDLATLIATSDDFVESRRRRQFSPRIGVSFPITESSSAFFNFGRYGQNPLYNNVFQATGIGTPAEGTVDGPVIQSVGRNNPFLGNANLLVESTTAYEIGYLAQIAEDYALSAILYSKDQTGLTGLKTGGVDAQGDQIFDPGVTYAGTNSPSYLVTVNQDFATVRGIEVAFRKRLRDYWAFSLNYAYSRAMTNAAPPLRQNERLVEGLSQTFREITSGIDQPHNFNGTLAFRVGNESPFDGVLGAITRNAGLSVVARVRSGFPFTPQADNTGLGLQNPGRREINSERGPATFEVNLKAQKGFSAGALNYSVYMRVDNVFDRINCIQVSPQSGECEQGAFDFLNRRVGNGANSSTSLDRPQRIGDRREIRAGVRVRF